MCPCDSPGSVLAMLIIALLSKGPKVNERQTLAKQRMSLAGFCALKQALRTGWLRSPFMRLVLPPSLSMGQAISMPPSIANKSR